MLLLFSSFGLAADHPFPDDAGLELLWNEGEFTEGVAAAPDGTIYFSDIPSEGRPGRVLRFDPASGQTRVHCADSGKSNGLMFDRQGRLIACCGANEGRQALCEITPDGQVKGLVDRFNGRRFNSPNDLVIHPDGSVFFSDPRYVEAEPLELDHQSIYRFVPATGRLERATTTVSKPNGVILSPDGRTLYVAETDNGTTGNNDSGSESPRVRMRLIAFTVQPDGRLVAPRVLVDFGNRMGIDGMSVDQQGHVYAAVRSRQRHGIAVYDTEGSEVAFLTMEALPTNCCFGRGEELSTLYITADKGLYRVPLRIDGHHLSQSE